MNLDEYIIDLQMCLLKLRFFDLIFEFVLFTKALQ